MDFNVCFVCLKTIRRGDYPKSGLGLVQFPFWNFVRGYLGIKNAVNESAEEALFCEDCESCVEDICQLYSELVAVQLRLSVKLGDLGELLQNSKKTVSNKMGVALIRKLAGQMGFDKPAHVDQFRNLLIKKCQLKWRDSLPDVKIERIPTPKSCRNSNTDEQSEDQLEETEEDFIQAASLEDDYDMDEASIILPSPGPYSPTVSETDPLSDVPSTLSSVPVENPNEDNHSSMKRSEKIRVGMKKRIKRWVTKVKETYAKDEVDDKQDEDYIPEESESECTTSTKSRKKPGTVIFFDCSLTKIGSGETYKCSKCDGIIRNTFDNLRAHVVKEHTDRLVCSQCGEHFGTMRNLKSHLAKHGKIRQPTPKSPCLICGRPTSVIKMKHHVWSHYSEEDKAASLARGERPPYERKTKQSFKCDQCSRSFCFMKKLEAHVKEKHAGPTPPKKKKLCPVCGEEVNNLFQHSKTHKSYDERKYVCVLCDKKFGTQYALHQHKFNVHSSEKPVQCELCGKNFKTESNLKDHHKHMHVNGGKVYQCGSCPRNFIQRACYEKHLVNKHGVVTQLLEYGPDEQELKLLGTAATSS